VGTITTTSRAHQGEETRRNILRLAVDVASQRGLDALTIGELAKELQMSKSGLFAHFGSKEDLQIETIAAAELMFGEAIVRPAFEGPPGLARLASLLEGYIVRYLEQSVFSGGCFFAAAASEFDDRPGRVRDRIALSMRKWNDKLEAEIRNGIEAGELLPEVEPAQLAFELQAITHHANFSRRLMADERAFMRARNAIFGRLTSVSTPHGRAVLAATIPQKHA
jgi:AcrR family transcriptional regulator